MFASLMSLEGLFYISRWLHFFFGVMWIGHLYYFNFTQGSAMAQFDAGAKSAVTTKLLPIALHWFRWGAMWTLVSGLVMFGLKGHSQGLQGAWGVSMMIGATLGITMWANVWFVIWPNQKIVMASANQVASGGAALPEAAQAAPKALLASRTNTMFSIPMLFFMGAAAHPFYTVAPESNLTATYVVLGILWLMLEANALKGKLGPMQTPKGVIACGFGLTAAIFIVMSAFI